MNMMRRLSGRRDQSRARSKRAAWPFIVMSNLVSVAKLDRRPPRKGRRDDSRGRKPPVGHCILRSPGRGEML